MKRYERAVTTFHGIGFDLRPANPAPPSEDGAWALVCVVPPGAHEVLSTAYWQREIAAVMS